MLPFPLNTTTNTPDLTLLDHDIAKPILTADSRFPPYRLWLTEGLHLKTANWTVTSVNFEEQGAWPLAEGEFIVIGAEPPSIRLARALFTINFLNCSFEGLNPPVVRHFGASPQFHTTEKPPIMIKDPETGKTDGPHGLVTWGRGYACVSTPTGPKWIPSKWTLGELAHLECWVAKQANLTTDALTNLLSDEETTRQATLQSRAAIDYLLLLHSHQCEEFEGLCCFNLTSRAENIHESIRQMKEVVANIKREMDDWLSGLFGSWGLSGWVTSVIKTILLCLFVLMLVIIAFGLLKRMLYNLVSTTHSPTVNRLHAPSRDQEENVELELEERPDTPEDEEGRNPDMEEHGLGYPTQHEWFAELYPQSEYLPPPFQFRSF
ncbi:hypothetical protein DUI87_03851 [Hirundo rustica rustica]|uniref:Integrase-type domain-containing protein n=1 Tax=Hirundo rustica rustica TaxID=333673 RepID=A0A3M0L1G3_HIRRU|nr:hypothetical protein DUI87_03851 [Hirundo rustica rustica]